MGDDFKLVFKFQKSNEWKVFRKSILFHFGFVGGLIYYLITNESVGLIVCLGSLLFIAPQIFLHLQYRKNDIGKTIILNYSKRSIKIEKYGILKHEIRFSEIEKLIRKKGQHNEENMTYAFPTFFYNHTIIQMKNGDKVYFTDFIASNIGLKDIKKEERISLLNVIE